MPKITYEKVTRNKDSSFSVIDYYNPYFAAPLHIHPEYELILIEEGTGTMYVGNFTKPLEQGDLLLIGPNLTHLWLSSECYYKPDVSMFSHSVYCQNVSFLTRNIGLLKSNRFTIYCTNL